MDTNVHPPRLRPARCIVIDPPTRVRCFRERNKLHYCRSNRLPRIAARKHGRLLNVAILPSRLMMFLVLASGTRNGRQAGSRINQKVVSASAARATSSPLPASLPNASSGLPRLPPCPPHSVFVLACLPLRVRWTDVPETDFCGAKPGRALSVQREWHAPLVEALTSIPVMEP